MNTQSNAWLKATQFRLSIGTLNHVVHLLIVIANGRIRFGRDLIIELPILIGKKKSRNFKTKEILNKN